MKRAALYLRVSTVDQHPETQLYDLRQLSQQRGAFRSFTSTPTKSAAPRRSGPGWINFWLTLWRGQFEVVVVWAADLKIP